jgi:hypothetical protein
MDNSFAIKPSPGVLRGYAARDPVAVREAVETNLGATKAVTAAGDHGGPQRDPRHDHPPQAVVADPESIEVINRENDVRTQASARENPDRALLCQRAYRPLRDEADPPAVFESQANIKA